VDRRGRPGAAAGGDRSLEAGFLHGEGARLGERVAIKETVAGRRLTVGDDVRLERCVLGDDVTILSESFLVDCVVGDGETVGGARADERIWSRPVPAGYPRKQVGNALQ